MDKTLALVLFLCSSCFGQILAPILQQAPGGVTPTNVDIVVHGNTSTVGTQITATILANSTDNQSLLATWSPAGTQANWTLGASAHNLVNGFKVNSNSDTYNSGSASKTLSLSNAAAFTTWAQPTIPSGHTAITVAGFVEFAPASTGSSNTLFDYINVQTLDGHAGIMQLRTGGTQSSPACTTNAYVVEIETNPGGTTTHSGCITLTPATTYWISFKIDSVAGTADLYIFDTTGITQIGHISSSFGTTSSNIAAVTLGNGESGTAAVTSTFQWTVFDWTAAAQPIKP